MRAIEKLTKLAIPVTDLRLDPGASGPAETPRKPEPRRTGAPRRPAPSRDHGREPGPAREPSHIREPGRARPAAQKTPEQRRAPAAAPRAHADASHTRAAPKPHAARTRPPR